MDEVFIRILSVEHYLWRAVDQDGVVLDIPVQARRDAQVAKRMFKRPLTGLQYEPGGNCGRQVAQLQRHSESNASWRRTSTQPVSQWSGRGLTLIDMTTRAADAALQIVPASSGLSPCLRPHLRPLLPPPTPPRIRWHHELRSNVFNVCIRKRAPRTQHNRHRRIILVPTLSALG
ncbi:DDE-type integrase/transposase/recombinase [Acidisphaera sp. S103]|uniref:DDE-type integrase/transposase/recombinase n=1 Tax=Acidisphaera sp. S103 TaxID=1747223 RepID=UPI00131CF45B